MPGGRPYREQYLDALLAADATAARAVVDTALALGVPTGAVYLEVIGPAMEEVGRRWEAAEITVADEHLATAITQGVLAGLAMHLPRTSSSAAGRVAVTGSGPGDDHGIGSRVVADFLAAAGWKVLDLGANTPAEGFAQIAARHDARVVAVSTSLSQHLDGVRRVRAALDGLERPPLLVVGGRAYGGSEDRARRVGADLFAQDPATLLERLETAVVA